MIENCRVNDCQKRLLIADNENLRAALKRAHQWLTTSGMDATAKQIEDEVSAALGLAE